MLPGRVFAAPQSADRIDGFSRSAACTVIVEIGVDEIDESGLG